MALVIQFIVCIQLDTFTNCSSYSFIVVLLHFYKLETYMILLQN